MTEDIKDKDTMNFEDSDNDEEENVGEKKDLEKDGGIIKELIKAGTGWEKPKKDDDITVHYDGTLENGEKFDSSRDRGSPFKFKLGAGKVIKGWEKVVATMKKGEISKVTLKPEYAYGENGAPPKIPPNATLIFEIELLSFTSEKDLTDDGSVLKKVIEEGQGEKKPSYETKCKFHVKLTGSDGHVYQDTTTGEPQTVTLGNVKIPEGLQKALESMKAGEKATFKIKANYAFGNDGNKSLGIPANTDLVYEIHMLEIKKAKESWDLDTFAEKEEVALKRKNDGNKLFEQGHIDLALEKYNKAVDLLKNEKSSEEEKNKVKAILLPCYSNLAACYLKSKNYKKTIDSATKALEIDSNNVKALWRRGTAYTDNGDWSAAKDDYNKALEIDPNNEAVKKSLERLKKIITHHDAKDKKRFQNLFQRLQQLEQEDEANKGTNNNKDDQNQQTKSEDSQAQQTAKIEEQSTSVAGESAKGDSIDADKSVQQNTGETTKNT